MFPIALAIAAVVAVAAAGGGTEPPDTRATGTGIELPSDEVLVARAFVFLGVGDATDLVRAVLVDHDRLTSCMTEAGFEYFIYEMAASDPQYTLDPLAFAEQYGLGITSNLLGEYPAPPTDDIDYIASLSDEDGEAYLAAEKACVAQVSGEWVGAFGQAESTSLDTFRSLVWGDPRVSAATDAWRRCMAQHDLLYESPDAMRSEFNERAQSSEDREELETLLAEEIRVAMINVPCEQPYTAAVRETIQNELDAYKDLLTQADLSGTAQG